MAKRERVSRIGELGYAQNGMCCKIPYRSLSLSDVTKECAMSRASEEEKCYGKPDAMLWYMELPLRCSLDYEMAGYVGLLCKSFEIVPFRFIARRHRQLMVSVLSICYFSSFYFQTI